MGAYLENEETTTVTYIKLINYKLWLITTTTLIDYDSGGKASLSAMCEIVVEACQSWFPQDKK